MIERMGRLDAVGFLAKFHYLGTLPSNYTDIFGWRENGQLTAIATYGQCHVPKLSDTFGELQRLAARPGLEAPLSRFLSRTIREMSRRGPQALITWADPAAGHHGGIYQATNWIYCEPRSYNWNASYRTPEGEVLTHRQVFDRYGTSAKTKVLARHPDWIAFLPDMKHRYIYPLQISKHDCLNLMKAREMPYPKPDVTGEQLQRPSAKMRQWTPY